MIPELPVGFLLNRTLEVWRPQTADDGVGGQEVTFARQADVRAKVDQPSASERLVAAQWGSEHSHNIYVPPDADVARGDELRGDGQVFRVLATVQPSTPIYTKALVELRQPEGT